MLYTSVWPPVFPYTQAVIASAVYLAFSIAYSLWIWKKKPEIRNKIGKTVNIVEEERQQEVKE
ncbi:MAG: amino acid permease-associated protein [Candidatus Aramenus sulfurataquae]|uniref:Amino acid permease-associated protein n=2 Tax=Candidatus Aramenus sulfurataquae TaxID=1326980 RepID=W7KNQ4_9CREN|nr:MAG: amino acid permease-associated protein [Candidatus Aramenus sulfurataquae]MCL7344267.1 hypothetical protein [Candidatus Aramenus sulfurataquae]